MTPGAWCAGDAPPSEMELAVSFTGRPEPLGGMASMICLVLRHGWGCQDGHQSWHAALAARARAEVPRHIDAQHSEFCEQERVRTHTTSAAFIALPSAKPVYLPQAVI